MRIRCLLVLCGAVACSADELTMPRVTPTPQPLTRVCIDNCSDHHPVREPYLMVIDGIHYHVPEDSLRVRISLEHLQPDDIEMIEIFEGASAAQLYGTLGPAIAVTTKRTGKHH